MKKFAALLVLLLLCAGCRQTSAPPPRGAEVTRVTAVLPHDDLGYWTSVANGLRDAQADFAVDVKISFPSTNYSVPQMVELIKAATAARVDAIIVQGVEDNNYIAALENAREKGIEILFVDTDLPDFPDHPYIGTDNYAAGRMLGEKLAEAAGGGAVRIGIISGAPGYPNLELRVQGLRDVISAYPEMKIVRMEYDQYDSLTLIEKYGVLSEPELDIDTLVCVEGTAAMTMGGMLEKRTERFRRVIGFDYSEESLSALRRGMVDGLVIQQPHGMGYRCVEECARFAAGKGYSRKVIHLDTTFITAGDLDEEGGYASP